MKSLKKELHDWDIRHTSFTKLQHAYAGIAALSLVAAGVIGLINYQLGQSILFVAMCALLIFISNGVVWALLRTFLAAPATPQPTKRKK